MSEAAHDVASFGAMKNTHKLFVCLACVFVSCLLIGDVIGGKTLTTPLGPISVGIIPFPITFLLTDVVIPEMSGPALIRRIAPSCPLAKVLFIGR